MCTGPIPCHWQDNKDCSKVLCGVVLWNRTPSGKVGLPVLNTCISMHAMKLLSPLVKVRFLRGYRICCFYSPLYFCCWFGRGLFHQMVSMHDFKTIYLHYLASVMLINATLGPKMAKLYFPVPLVGWDETKWKSFSRTVTVIMIFTDSKNLCVLWGTVLKFSRY